MEIVPEKISKAMGKSRMCVLKDVYKRQALDNARTKDLGEIGSLLTDVVGELKGFDEEEEKGFLGFFKKSSNKLTAMKARYAKAESNVNQICKMCIRDRKRNWPGSGIKKSDLFFKAFF